jgi:hypothetical protein
VSNLNLLFNSFLMLRLPTLFPNPNKRAGEVFETVTYYVARLTRCYRNARLKQHTTSKLPTVKGVQILRGWFILEKRQQPNNIVESKRDMAKIGLYRP